MSVHASDGGPATSEAAGFAPLGGPAGTSGAIPLPTFTVHGRCLAPLIPPGASVTFDSSAPPRSGDIVAVLMLFEPHAIGAKILEFRKGHGWWFRTLDDWPIFRYRPDRHVICGVLESVTLPAVPQTTVAPLTPDDVELHAELRWLARDAAAAEVMPGVEFIDERTADETAAVARLLLRS